MATVRTIRADELDELLTLYRMLNPDDPELAPDEVADQWADMMDDDSLEIAVVEHDERLVASCMLSVTESLTRGARPFALVENAVTHEDHRQNGFGKLCVREAIDVAERENCYKVMLMTGSDREWTHEFSDRCGFDSAEETGVVCHLRDD